MNLTDDQITEIFFHIDEFVKSFKQQAQLEKLPEAGKRKYKQRKPKMSDAEVMTVLVCFHL